MVTERVATPLVAAALAVLSACNAQFDTAPAAGEPVTLTAGRNVPVTLEGPSTLGASARFKWLLIEAPAGSSPILRGNGSSAVFICNRSGQAVIDSVAVDGELVLAQTRFLVTVTNEAPSAVIETGFATTTAAYLRGTASSDPNGDELAYFWRIVVQPVDAGAYIATPTAPNASLITSVPGVYEISLRVDDGDGGVGEATVSLRVFGPTFPPTNVGGRYGSEVYSRPREELILSGTPVKVLDVNTGSVRAEAAAGPGDPMAISPNGERVTVRSYSEQSYLIYDLDTQSVLAEEEFGYIDPLVMSDEAIYWLEQDYPDWYIRIFHAPTLQEAQTQASDLPVEYPIVSPALGILFVPIRSATGFREIVSYEIYSLDFPPVFQSSGTIRIPWTRLGRPAPGIFEDRRRVLVNDGPLVELSAQGITVCCELNQEFDDFAHNSAVGAFAIVLEDRLRVYSDTTNALLRDWSIADWSPQSSRTRVLPYRSGFLLVDWVDATARSLYVDLP